MKEPAKNQKLESWFFQKNWEPRFYTKTCFSNVFHPCLVSAYIPGLITDGYLQQILITAQHWYVHFNILFWYKYQDFFFNFVYWVLEIGIFHPKIKLKISLHKMGTNVWCFTWLKIKIVGLLFLSNCTLFAQLCHYYPRGRCFRSLSYNCEKAVQLHNLVVQSRF